MITLRPLVRPSDLMFNLFYLTLLPPVNAIKWGRNVYDSIRKFLQFQLTVCSLLFIYFSFFFFLLTLYQQVTTVAVILSIVGSILWDEAPLSPIQMLWVNLIMDTFASLALATEAPTEKLLDRPPYGRTEPVITRKMWRFILGSAVLQLGVVFFFIYAAPLIPWVDLPTDRSTWTGVFIVTSCLLGSCLFIFLLAHQYRVRGTMVFNTFVWLQIFNLFHARKLEDEWNIFSGLLGNWVFWAVVIFSGGMQAIIVQFGGSPASVRSLSHTLHHLDNIRLTLITPFNVDDWSQPDTMVNMHRCRQSCFRLGFAFRALLFCCLAFSSMNIILGFIIRRIPIRNVVRPADEEGRDEEKVPLSTSCEYHCLYSFHSLIVKVRKKHSEVSLRDPAAGLRGVLDSKEGRSRIRAREHWRKLASRWSIIYTLRRKRI